jgi:propanol-preferring alcohol dehydrogenase
MVNQVEAVVSIAGSDHHISVNPSLLILKQLTINGSLVGTRDDVHTVLKFAQRGLIKKNYQIIFLGGLPERIQLMKEGKVTRKVVVDLSL